MTRVIFHLLVVNVYHQVKQHTMYPENIINKRSHCICMHHAFALWMQIFDLTDGALATGILIIWSICWSPRKPSATFWLTADNLGATTRLANTQADEGDKRKCDKCSLLIYLVVMVIWNNVFTCFRLCPCSAFIMFACWVLVELLHALS